MKLPTSKTGQYDSGPNLLPVVNITMVVLIVFMIGASFAGPEHYLETRVPLTETGIGGAPAPEDYVPEEPFEILVNPYGDGVEIIAGNIRTTDMNVLRATLHQRKEQFAATGKLPPLVISPTGNVHYEYLIAVFEAANEAEFNRVSFASARQ